MPPITWTLRPVAPARWFMVLRNPSAGNENGSTRRRKVSVPSGTSSGKPAMVQPSPELNASSRSGVHRPKQPAHRLSPARSSISWEPPTTDTAVVPISALGCRAWRTTSATSPMASTWASVAKSTARSGWRPASASATSPTTSATAWRASGCSEDEEAYGMCSTGCRQQVVRDHRGRALVDAAVGLDRAVVGELDLAPHQAVAELPRLDLDGLHVAGDVLAVSAVDDLEDGVAGVVGRAMDDDHEVGRPHEGRSFGGHRREVGPREVDPGGGTLDLADVDALDEERREDV